MRSTFLRGTALALLPALGVLVLAGCSGNSTSGSSPSTTPTSAPSSAPSTTPGESDTSTPSTTASSSAQQADVTINITVANGKVTPNGQTIMAKAGQTVLVTAVSDAADEVHIHGYDKQLPLTPGKPASVKFTANVKGTFEIETHESGKLVVKLVVS